jgi:hypothetical protein
MQSGFRGVGISLRTGNLTGNFQKSGLWRRRRCELRRQRWLHEQIPCANEQGILAARAGNFRDRAGNPRDEQATPSKDWTLDRAPLQSARKAVE